MMKKVICLMVILLFGVSLQASSDQSRHKRITFADQLIQISQDAAVGDQGARLFAAAFEIRVSRLEISMDHRREENRVLRKINKELTACQTSICQELASLKQRVHSNSDAFTGCFHFGPDIQRLKREHSRLEDRYRTLSGEFRDLQEKFDELVAAIKKTDS
jgi:hypothetical protein